MSNAQSVKTQLQNLINSANATTGNTDVDLTSAIGSLIGGYGQGGSVEGLAYDMGEFVLDEDKVYLHTVDGNGIPHSLGEVPNFILVWTDDFSDLSADNVNPYGITINIGYIWLNGLFGMMQRLTSAINSDFGVFVSVMLVKDAYVLSVGSPTSASYVISSNSIPTAEQIGLPQMAGVSQKWKAGVKYKYFVSRNWWEVFDNVE